MHTWDYDIHTYQPTCYNVTATHRSGGIMWQQRQCPPPVQYCTHSRTGVRIKCPYISPKHREEDFKTHMAVYYSTKRAHQQEECQMVAEYNRTRPRGSEALTVIDGTENPYCDAYGQPRR